MIPTARRADRMTALVLLALGLVLLWAGFTMDRLEIRRIHPASIPGLVPMLLGGALTVCAALLYASAAPRGEAGEETGDGTGEGGGDLRDLALATALSLIYALVLVGRLPFFAATAIFVAGFLIVFDRGRRMAVRVPLAIGFGLAVAAAVSALFRYAFLVRLP